jgi:hypothetical protein
VYTVRKVVSCRFAELIIIYISHLSFALQAFKVSILNLWDNFNWLMILAVVITNASKTGRADVLGRTAYFVNKQIQSDLLLEWKYIWLNFN